MGDFESFSGFDAGGDAFNAAAFEKFKERMKAAAAQLKAIQAGEQKQKKSEDELIKILLKFITSGKQGEILMLVLRMLEMNVPAGFIVSELLISHKDIQEVLNIKLLPPPEIMAQHHAAEKWQEAQKQQGIVNDAPDQNELSPAEYIGHAVLPLKIKIAIDNWINEMTKRVNEHPHKILQLLFEPDRTVNLTAVQLATFCLRDYLESEGMPAEYAKLKEFIDLVLGKILNDMEEELKNRKELKGGTDQSI